MNKKKVSIWCTTYNHCNYIKRTLDSFLMQHTTFNYEVIIYDDASTDGTTQIIQEYAKNHPDNIKLLIMKENKYEVTKKNFKWKNDLMLGVSEGEYIAFCEGDDYWIDENKLQIQVDYMDKHKECACTGHGAIQAGEEGLPIVIMQEGEERDLSPKELIIRKGNIMIPTASLMYRRDVLRMEDFFYQVGIGDYPTQLYSLLKGTFHYFPRNMSVYRYQCSGSWTATMRKDREKIFEHYLKMMIFSKKYDSYTKKKYHLFLEQRIYLYMNNLISFWKDSSKKEFENVCSKYESIDTLGWVEEIKKWYLMFYGDKFEDKKLNDFVSFSSSVYIWGTGVYSKVLEKYIDNSKISGYIVSENKKGQEQHHNKPVYTFEQIKGKNVNFVIAMNYDNYNAIQKKIRDFSTYYPFIIQSF
ncbi:MAG: hypothetical protein BHW48_02990 [Roseburia sp. CAG:10041_57]|nr:MAG: hypothetical protein BHW48_02990 [Roseburia sp. CAG:10041_57]